MVLTRSMRNKKNVKLTQQNTKPAQQKTKPVQAKTKSAAQTQVSDTEKMTRWIPKEIEENFQSMTGFDIYQIIKYLLILSIVSIIVLSILSHTNSSCTKMNKCTLDCRHISLDIEEKDIKNDITKSKENCWYYYYHNKLLNIIRTIVNIFLILFFSYYIHKYRKFLFFEKDEKIEKKDLVKSFMIWIFIIKIFLDFSYILIPILIQLYELLIEPFIKN